MSQDLPLSGCLIRIFQVQFLLVIALVCTLLACNEKEEEQYAVCHCPNDATIYPDAFGPCDPVTQQGCEPAEKCAQITASDDPFFGVTACVPLGTMALGEPCLRGEAGASGFDDCAAGLHCIFGVCHRICDVGPPATCRESGEALGGCVQIENVFDDTIGICIDSL